MIANKKAYQRAWYLAHREQIRIKGIAYRKANKEKIKISNKKYYRENKEFVKLTNWRCNIKRRYGITIKQYDTMYEQQDGHCAICGKELIKGVVNGCCIDHCHETGKVRGLLCDSCNVGLGRFNDNPDTLIKASSYIKADGRI